MKPHYKKISQDPLAEMLQKIPLEQPSTDFTEKVMNRIPTFEVESKIYFYQKPLFIAAASITFAACFLLFYNADFSFLILLQQLGHYYTIAHNYLSTLHFSPRQITFSPLIVAPLLLLFCIFIADRAMETYKKHKEHQIFCI